MTTAAVQDAYKRSLPMRLFRVRVLVVPPKYETAITGAQPYEDTRVIQGYTLADAKKRAGTA